MPCSATARDHASACARAHSSIQNALVNTENKSRYRAARTVVKFCCCIEAADGLGVGGRANRRRNPGTYRTSTAGARLPSVIPLVPHDSSMHIRWLTGHPRYSNVWRLFENFATLSFLPKQNKMRDRQQVLTPACAATLISARRLLIG